MPLKVKQSPVYAGAKAHYCVKHKSVRLKSLYARTPRSDGQTMKTVGYACPVCKKVDLSFETMMHVAIGL